MLPGKPVEASILAEAFCDSQILTLTQVNPASNKVLFEDSERALHIFDFLCRQDKLQQLDLRSIYINSELTEELLTQLAYSKALHTIQEIILWFSANFDSDAAAEACANIVANGLALRKINIGLLEGSR